MIGRCACWLGWISAGEQRLTTGRCGGRLHLAGRRRCCDEWLLNGHDYEMTSGLGTIFILCAHLDTLLLTQTATTCLPVIEPGHF